MNAAATRMGLATTLLTFIAGVWLFLAPLVVGYQDFSRDWTEATKNDLWMGGALIGFGALTPIVFLAFALRDVAYQARRREQERASHGDERRRYTPGGDRRSDERGSATVH